jgi:CheY-like chemotaxis protein
MDVLIVDDNEALAAALASYMESKGLTTSTLGDIHGALRAVESEPPRLLLVSQTLPGGGGLEIARRVQALSGPKPTVLLLTSVRPTSSLRRDVEAAGAGGIVRKTMGPRAIHERVVAVLRDLGTRRTGPAGEPRGINPEVLEALKATKKRSPASPSTVGFDVAPSFDPGASDRPRGTPAPPRPDSRANGPKDDAERAFREGLVILKYNDHKAAQRRFAEAWSRDATSPRYLAWKAWCEYLLAGRPADPQDSLADDMRLVITLDPSCAEGHRFLGEIYADAGEMDRARDCLRVALKLAPDDPESRKAMNRVRRNRS